MRRFDHISIPELDLHGLLLATCNIAEQGMSGDIFNQK